MASGIINLTARSDNEDSNLYARIVWESTADSSSNTSTLTLKYQLRRDTYTDVTSSNYFMYATLTDDGERVDYYEYATSYPRDIYNTSWNTNTTTSTHTITHDSTGKASITISASISSTDYYNVFEATKTITLDTINRKATITSAPNFTDTDNPKITYSNPAGSAVSALEACIANSTGYTIYVPYRNISKTGSSYTFNLTDDERATLIAAAGNSTTLAVRFYVRTTIGGSTYLSYLSKTMTINADGPTLTVSVADANTTTVALTGGGDKFIKGYNSMQFSMTAEGQKGATISSYSVTCGAHSSSNSSGTFNNVESDVFIFSATDSRGITSTKIVVLDMVEYIKVTCNQTVRMVLESEDSAQVNVTISGNYFNQSFGAKSNTLNLYVRHTQNDGTMGDWADLAPLLYETDGNTYTLNFDVSGLDASGTYTFQCKAVDALGTTATSDEYAVKLMPVFDWSKTDFNFNVPITIEGNPLVDFVIETGTEVMGTNGTWYWRKWASGRADCYGCRNYGTMAVTTTWGGLYRSETFTQSLPSGLFVDTPEVMDVTFRGGSNVGGWIVSHENSAPDASTTGSFILVRPASATLTSSYLSFNVIGRWK